MKIFIAAGGTGGHFYPGLSTAKALASRGHAIHFLVRKKDMVIPLLEKEGFSYSELHSAGFRRAVSFSNLKSALLILFGSFQARRIFKKERPDALLAMGGYLSVPAALGARGAGVPIFLHEQNVKPGLANRLVARWADHVAVSFEESAPYFEGKAILTGNPVRSSILNLPDQKTAKEKFLLHPEKPVWLIFGGSQGASALNQMVVKTVLDLKERSGDFQVLHFTGVKDEGWIQASYKGWEGRSFVSAYCHEMDQAFAACDFILCRAGASTVSELSEVKKPALIVPYPFASGDHQRFNGEILSKTGAAVLIDQRALTAERLKEILVQEFLDKNSLKKKSRAFERVKPLGKGAAEKIADLLESGADSKKEEEGPWNG